MILPGVDPEVRCHQPGDTVWIVKQNGSVDDAQVLSTRLELCQDTRPAEKRGIVPFHFVPTGYTLNVYKYRQLEMVTFYRTNEVFATKEAATASVEWWNLKGIDEATWLMALGTRALCGELAGDDGELMRCCRHVEIVRDMLRLAKDVGGLRGIDRNYIRTFYGEHPYPWNNGARPLYLDKIFDGLGIRIHHRIPPDESNA